MTTGVRWLTAELDVAYSSPQEFGQVALAWLTEGVQALAADLSAEILAGPPLKAPRDSGVIDESDPRFKAQEPPLWGDVEILYPPRNRSYVKPYSRTSLKRLDTLATEMREAIVSLQKEVDGPPRSHALEVIREGEDRGYARLLTWLDPDSSGEFSADGAAAVFLRGFADRHAPVFGHVSPVNSARNGETQLEQALIRYPRHAVWEWDRYLRGYSWVTVVPAELAGRLGGAAGLRASGVFAVVEEVAGGSLWLQATPRWSQYAGDQVVVDRVFDVLAPVLPPGKPLPYKLVRPAMPGAPDLPEIRAPYLVSLRDAADYGTSR
jgi:hypothetical protein